MDILHECRSSLQLSSKNKWSALHEDVSRPPLALTVTRFYFRLRTLQPMYISTYFRLPQQLAAEVPYYEAPVQMRATCMHIVKVSLRQFPQPNLFQAEDPRFH
jgi:hypothetical protein